jgi:putative endonuclease
MLFVRQRFFIFYPVIYTVYILQSLVDSSFYIGYSANPEKRLLQHNKTKTGYSARKIPCIIVYTETSPDKSSAIKREKFLKNQKSRQFMSEV